MSHPSSLCTFIIWLGFSDALFELELPVLPSTQCMTLELQHPVSAKYHVIYVSVYSEMYRYKHTPVS